MVRLARDSALLLLLAASAAGCAGLFGGTGPGGGLPDYERNLRQALAAGRYREALGELSDTTSRIGDELLRLQFRGLAAHYAGEPRASSDALESAAFLAEERYTRSLTNEALSLLTNDRVRPYRPGNVERLLIHHYGALNYLAAGDREEAAVEARRLAHMLDRVEDESPDWAGSRAGRSLRSVLRRVTGVVFEAAGERNDAEVAYRLAERTAPPGAGPTPAAADTLRPDSSTVLPRSRPAGEVVLIVEQGFAPHRIERSAVAVLGLEDVRRLHREADELRARERQTASLAAVADTPEAGGDSSAVATSLAREFLGKASGSRRARRVRLAGDSDGGLRLLRLAWPELAAPVAAGPLRGVRPTDSVEAETAAAADADVAGAVAAEFRNGQVGRLARTLLRAAAKQAAVDALAEAAGDGEEEDDEGWGEALGTVASLFAAAVERADTRSWHLLPARISVLRVRLPPGEHRLALEIDTPGVGGRRQAEIGPVTVREGRPTVVAHRVWPPAVRLGARGR